MNYEIAKNLRRPKSRPSRRKSLDDLVALAKRMRAGHAALLPFSEVQTFRIILAAQGYACVSDGYRTTGEPGKGIWCFKLKP
jgi:hypothetical protein